MISNSSRKSWRLTTRGKDRLLYHQNVTKNRRRCLGVTVAPQQTLLNTTTTTRRKTRTPKCPAGISLKQEVPFASRPFSARKSQHKKIIAWPNSTLNNNAFSLSSQRGGQKSSKSRSSTVSSCEKSRIRTGMLSWRCRRSWEQRPAAQSSASVRVVGHGTSPIIWVSGQVL